MESLKEPKINHIKAKEGGIFYSISLLIIPPVILFLVILSYLAIRSIELVRFGGLPCFGYLFFCLITMGWIFLGLFRPLIYTASKKNILKASVFVILGLISLLITWSLIFDFLERDWPLLRKDDRNPFIEAYVHVSHSPPGHQLWSTALISTAVAWAVCILVTPCPHLLKVTHGFGPLMFLVLGELVAISTSFSLFLAYHCLRPACRASNSDDAFDKSSQISFFIFICAVICIILLPVSEPHSFQYISSLSILHLVILLPGVFWAVMYNRQGPTIPPSSKMLRASGTVLFILHLYSIVMALLNGAHISSFWDLLLQNNSVNSCQQSISFDLVFIMIPLGIWHVWNGAGIPELLLMLCSPIVSPAFVFTEFGWEKVSVINKWINSFRNKRNA